MYAFCILESLDGSRFSRPILLWDYQTDNLYTVLVWKWLHLRSEDNFVKQEFFILTDGNRPHPYPRRPSVPVPAVGALDESWGAYPTLRAARCYVIFQQTCGYSAQSETVKFSLWPIFTSNHWIWSARKRNSQDYGFMARVYYAVVRQE